MTLEKFEKELRLFVESILPQNAYSNTTSDHDHEMGIWVINVDGSEFDDHPASKEDA